MYTVILGAGISGLTAARELRKFPDQECHVFEQASTPGGLCRAQEREGFRFDVVSHVLHFRSNRARDLVRELLRDSLVSIERSAWIFFRGRYIPYPFQSHLGFLPWPQRLTCLGSYCQAWAHRQMNGKRPPNNFEEWIRYHFGSGIARHFMIPYNTELWGLRPREMSTDWVRPFVPRISLKETMEGLLTNRTARVGYNSYFSYPVPGGMQALVNALSSSVPNLEVNRETAEVDLDRKTVRFNDREMVKYDHLISTIPLDVFIQQARGVPERLRNEALKLRCSRLLNIVYCIRRPLPHPYHWVYFPESQFPFFRLVFPSNISTESAPAGCGVVCAEISNPSPGNLDQLEASARSQLVRLGIIADSSDIAFTEKNYLAHAYPAHDLEREAVLARLLNFLKTKDVHSIGRFGGWRYSSIDDAIVGALDTVHAMAQQPAPVAP